MAASLLQFCDLDNETGDWIEQARLLGIQPCRGRGDYHCRTIVTVRTATTEHTAAHCLSIHAGYQCRHSGACCTAGWHIPAEPPVVAAIDLHFGPTTRRRFVEGSESSAGAAILATGDDGACIFFDAARGRSCRVHRELGERLLPSACRHFPRVTLSDARGTWITLSHFCPSAASLLFIPAPLHIVPAPDALSLSGTADGLDATDALPPLLRPGMLMDFEGYHAWERGAVDMLGAGGPDVSTALATLHEATREIQQWSPGEEPLCDRVTRVLAVASYTPIAEQAVDDARRQALAVASVPHGLTIPEPASFPGVRDPDITPLWRELDDVIRRYLASKLFASWWPYLGLDLAGVVEAVRVHAAVLRTRIAARLERHDAAREILLQAIRDTDLLMVHLSDSRALARLITDES
jgi:Fe-S-cluster containining protein